MKLSHMDFPCTILWKENEIPTLVIENSKLFAEFVLDFCRQTEGKEGKWILSKSAELLKISQACSVIVNPFALSVNQKKLLNALYEQINKETTSTELLLEWNQLYPVMVNTLDKIIGNMEYHLTYNTELEIKDFLKLMNLRFEESAENLLESLIDYITLTHEVLKTRLFVLVNIKSYLDETELSYLFEQIFYKKISILLIENHMSEQNFSYENVTIIDKDCCIISQIMSQ